jgi:hypothetical protein
MNKIRWAGFTLGAVVLVTGIARYDDEDFVAAQAATDRETVDCLTHRLTHDEKLHLARLTAMHDTESMHPVFTDVLARCVVRADQWDRRSQIVASARQMLSEDTEFRQMLNAGTMELAQRP